jgi:hypothetical protein
LNIHWFGKGEGTYKLHLQCGIDVTGKMAEGHLQCGIDVIGKMAEGLGHLRSLALQL